MARKPYFPHLTGSAGLWQPEKPDFAALAASALGQAGSPADRTESRIAELFNALDGSRGLHDSITQATVDLAGAITRADAIPLGDLDAAIAAATRQGPPMIAAAGSALAGLDFSDSWFRGLAAPPLPPEPTVGTVGAPGGGGGDGFVAGSVDSATIAAGALAAVKLMVLHGVLSSTLGVTLGLAIPIIGAAVAVVLLALHFIGGGCGQPCIEGSKAEQIYEASADNLYQAYKLGMISAVHAMAGMAYLISAGTHHLQQFNTPEANRGITNMTNTIHAEVQDVQVTKAPKPQPLNLAVVHRDYVSGPGWYPESITAAAQLSDTLLEEFAAQKAG